MKFVTNRDALFGVLGVAQDVISIKSPVSILSNVLLQTDKENQKVIVKCTNSTVNAITSFNAEIEEPGEITIFCDKLMNIISSLPPGDVEIFTQQTEIIVEPVAKKIKFKIKTLASDKFPVINEFVKENSISIAAKDLKNLINNTIFAVSTDRNRHIITGCYLCKKDNYLYMVATDMRRMSICKCVDFNSDFKDVIIPDKMLSIVEKYCANEGELLINSTGRMFMVKSGNLEISSSVFEGNYPSWQKVIPNGLDHTIIVSKKEFENAIKTAGIMLTKDSRIELNIEQNKLTVNTPETDIGSATEEIAAVYNDTTAMLVLNIQYVADVLKVINSENIAIDFKVNQENKVSEAIIIRESEITDTCYKHIIMPIRN